MVRSSARTPKLTGEETGNLTSLYLRKGLNLWLETFQQHRLQAQTASLVNSIKHLELTPNLQTCPENRREGNTLQLVLDTKTRGRTGNLTPVSPSKREGGREERTPTALTAHLVAPCALLLTSSTKACPLHLTNGSQSNTLPPPRLHRPLLPL